MQDTSIRFEKTPAMIMSPVFFTDERSSVEMGKEKTPKKEPKKAPKKATPEPKKTTPKKSK